MNRAEKRRQRKMAQQAARKSGPAKSMESSFQPAIDLAVQHQNAGRYSEAEGIYQQILRSDPNQPVALHLLGVIAFQVGKSDIAVNLITKALTLEPDYTKAHNNLGNALHSLGRLEQAVTSYHKAIALEPDYAESYNNLGNTLHSLGRLEQAEASYHKALDLKPNYLMAYNNLGNTLHDLGRLIEAEESSSNALKIQPDYAMAHSNLGNVLKDLERFDEAVSSHQKALALNPDFVEAHNNLANCYQKQGQLHKAVKRYQKALHLKPDYAEAHNNLGTAFQNLGQLEDAVASYQQALAIQPGYTEAYNNLGNALGGLGRLDEAVASFGKALSIDPECAMAHNNLGNTLKDLNQLDEAFRCHQRAVALDPENEMLWAGLATSLETISFSAVDDDLWPVLQQLLQMPTVRPANITRPLISAIRQHKIFTNVIESLGSGKSKEPVVYAELAQQLSEIPLLLAIMALCPLHDREIERIFTLLRRAMIAETIAGKIDKKCPPFSTALALQCFTNEYVFTETGEEKTSVEHLEQQIAALIENKGEIPSGLIATLAAYRPLYQYAWAQTLASQDWTDDIKQVIERQILEPHQEHRQRPNIPRLTTIENTVSQSVREQYEENPYPRWIKTDVKDKGRDIATTLRAPPLLFDLKDYVSPQQPQILIAGCGTGQHVVNTNSRFSNARILAVDLSLSSLSYATRKTAELGLTNIEFVQGDIMELASIGRQFDLIECSGVLHHLGDPLAGWRVLVDLLRPDGLMKIALYSELARQDIVQARSLIAEKAYDTSPEDIRQCRQDIIAMAEGGDSRMARLSKSRDFFSLSDCRDLIFHVQEHRFTIPQIKQALKTLNLEFLGFEMHNQSALWKFKAANPARRALTSLTKWHEFELEHPHTFRAMYQFWCRKL